MSDDWALKVDGLIARKVKNWTTFYKKVAFDVFAEVVRRTPVDNGTLRRNWICDVNRIPQETIDGTDPGGDAATNEAAKVINEAKLDETINIVNNLDYAEKIEYGGSRIKAPQGMVRVTVARWNQFLKDNEDELEK